jgi:hypothetical protein
MAVSVEPAAVNVPAAGGNVSLQLTNGNPEVLYFIKSTFSNVALFIFRFALPSSSSPATTSTIASTLYSDSWSPVLLLRSK